MALLVYNKQQYFHRSLKAKMILESQLKTKLLKLYKKYSSHVYQAYVLYGLPNFPLSFTQDLREILLSHYRKVGTYFSKFNRQFKKKEKKVISELDRKIQQRLESYYYELVTKRVTYITTTAQDNLSAYVGKLSQLTTEDGFQLSRFEIAKFLKDTLNSRSAGKADMISITETTQVAEKAKEIEVEEMVGDADEFELDELLGDDIPDDVRDEILSMGGAAALAAGLISITKVWNTVIDESTRPEHADADGQEVEISEPFEVGGESLMYPGDDSGSPENTINCRCMVSYDF